MLVVSKAAAMNTVHKYLRVPLLSILSGSTWKGIQW